MPKSRIMIQLDDEKIARIDHARGAIPRAAWFRIAADYLLDQASVSQQEENRSPKPGDAGSTPARRAGKGSPASEVNSGGRRRDQSRSSLDRASPSRPIKKGKGERRGYVDGLDAAAERSAGYKHESTVVRCVCGGVIIQDGSKAGQCTKCSKPKERKLL